MVNIIGCVVCYGSNVSKWAECEQREGLRSVAEILVASALGYLSPSQPNIYSNHTNQSMLYAC